MISTIGCSFAGYIGVNLLNNIIKAILLFILELLLVRDYSRVVVVLRFTKVGSFFQNSAIVQYPSS